MVFHQNKHLLRSSNNMDYFELYLFECEIRRLHLILIQRELPKHSHYKILQIKMALNYKIKSCIEKEK